MRIESKLCHVTENKYIVQVTGWVNEQKLGSALAEGNTVEVAEDKAIKRLNTRIHQVINDKKIMKSTNEDKIKPQLQIELHKSEIKNINNEPNDWSSELIAIDSEIERLKWSRDDEIKFLKDKLGYNNRNKITKYNDLLNYLNLLKKINISGESKLIKRNINGLIEDSDSILKQLSWDNFKGREFLKKEFNVLSRKELNEEQLISFVEKLISIRNQYQNH